MMISRSKDMMRPGVAHRLQRLFFALSIPGGAIAILIAALTNPVYYGSGPGEAAAIAANAAHGDVMDQAHNVFELAAAFLLPIGFLTLAWLVNRRTPWLATVGGALCVLGFVPLSLYVGQDSLYYDVARAGSAPQLVDLVVRWNHDGIMSFYGVWFGLGSVLGPTVLGVALWRSRQVPVWAAICLILSRLPVFIFAVVPFHVAVAVVIAGVVLMVAAGVPAARAVMTQHKQDQATARDATPAGDDGTDRPASPNRGAKNRASATT